MRPVITASFKFSFQGLTGQRHMSYHQEKLTQVPLPDRLGPSTLNSLFTHSFHFPFPLWTVILSDKRTYSAPLGRPRGTKYWTTMLAPSGSSRLRSFSASPLARHPRPSRVSLSLKTNINRSKSAHAACSFGLPANKSDIANYFSQIQPPL